MKALHVPLIGLAGRAGVGKSTIAQTICGTPIRDSGISGIRRLRFADPLKAALVAMGIAEHEVNGIDYDREQSHPLLCGRSVRHALQTLGTEWGRNAIGEDLWVKLAMVRADDLLGRGFGVVFDDLRFPNEAQALLDRGGMIVELTGRTPRTSDDHASEQSLPRKFISAEVVNDRTPLDAYGQILTAWHRHIRAGA